MRKRYILAIAVALAISGGLFAYQAVSTISRRADCPGKIVCPLTGQEICKDRCPLRASARADATAPSCCRRSQ